MRKAEEVGAGKAGVHGDPGRDALRQGTRFGELEILRVVAIGGFGIVYLARDHLLDREVAIKEYMPVQLACRGADDRLSLRSSDDAELFDLGLRSFVNEAKLLARFNHPAMVKVYRFWESNGTGYMVMPYLTGPTLRDVRRSMTEPPTEAWLRSIVDPLMDALEMLHAAGVYHRDVAPDNVLVPGPNAPVLLDFGAARRSIGDRTQTLTAILKPSYAPIEQYAESTQLRQGAWTDIYALAAVVVYLIDGVPPPPSTARAIHDDMPVLARRPVAGISARFLAALDWALAVRPQDRPQSIADLRAAFDGRQGVAAARLACRPGREPARDLESAAGSEPFEPTQPVAASARSRTPHAGMPARRVRRHVAAALVLLLGVGAGLLLTMPAKNAPAPHPALGAGAGASLPAVQTAPSPITPAASEPVLAAVDAPRAGATAVALPADVATAPARSLEPLLADKSESKAVDVAPSRLKSKRLAGADGKRAKDMRVTRANPVAACTASFFQSFCVTRRCTEPRYKNHPKCVRLREEQLAHANRVP